MTLVVPHLANECLSIMNTKNIKWPEYDVSILKDDIINALIKVYEANIEKANATIKIYLENCVGIGEHPNIIDEIDKQVDIVSANEQKIDIIRSFK